MSRLICISMKVLANSVDPDEMLHYMIMHLGVADGVPERIFF